MGRELRAIPGLDYANDLKWLSHRPHDPLHQLVAEAYVYGTCGSLVSSYDGTPVNDYARWVHDFYAVRAATTYHPG